MRRNSWSRSTVASILACGMMLCGCGGTQEYTVQAMQAIEDLDYRTALTLFAKAEEESENQKQIERGRGIAYMGLTEYEEAAACFSTALSHGIGLIEDMDFDINYYLAAAYQRNGKYEEAKAVYDAILALRPREKTAYFLRGNVNLYLDAYEEAVEDFDKTVALDPKNYDRMIEICQVLVHFGYKDKGQEYIKNVMAGSDKLKAYDIGRFYYYLEDYQKAYVALEEAKNDGGAEGYLYLGRAYEATGDYNYAATVYNGYLSKYGENAEVYNQLGVCEMKKQNYQAAYECFENGLRLSNAAVQQSLEFNMVVVLEYLQEYEEARSRLEQYLKAYPDDEEAKREWLFLKTR